MEGKKTLSLLSLIFSIVGIILLFTPVSIAGLVLIVLGLIFSIVGKKKEGKNGLATAGFIVSLIGIILFVIVVVVLGALMMGAIGLMAGLAG